jgi:2-dehydro-3-deoxyphosphogalactonate aldolase
MFFTTYDNSVRKQKTMMKTPLQIDEDLPLIAILRGIELNQAEEATNILIEEGFKHIEIPLNSPDALSSIRMLADTFGNNALIGAGTVTNLEQAKAALACGANLIVSPNFSEQVMALQSRSEALFMPGVITPTEVFKAIELGGHHLKLFPISLLGTHGLKALKAVIPNNVKVYPVGGIDPSIESMQPYLAAGADGFGLGSSLYKPGMSVQALRQNAKLFVTSYLQSVGKNDPSEYHSLKKG